MTHIKGHRDLDLHFDDGSGEHFGTARTANGKDVEQHERRIRAHLAAHAAEEVGEPAPPATVNREWVYAWLTKEESAADELPARVGVEDMWTDINEALSHKGRSSRAEDATFLVIAGGRDRIIKESLLAKR